MNSPMTDPATLWDALDIVKGERDDLQRKYDDALIRHEEIEVKLRAEIEELSDRLSRLKVYLRDKVVPMLENVGGF